MRSMPAPHAGIVKAIAAAAGKEVRGGGAGSLQPQSGRCVVPPLACVCLRVPACAPPFPPACLRRRPPTCPAAPCRRVPHPFHLKHCLSLRCLQAKIVHYDPKKVELKKGEGFPFR